jgi:hypothetical protein
MRQSAPLLAPKEPMAKVKDKSLILIVGAVMFLSVLSSLISNFYDSRVMGNTALGMAVLAPDPGSPDWLAKISLRFKADLFFYVSVFLGFVGVLLDLYVAFRDSERA